jgi:nitrate reductase gamma subunit
MARGLETRVALLERDGEDWLGGEAHVGHADPRSSAARLLHNLRADRVLLMGFGFASGLVIGIGLAILLSRRQQT